jgi:hypothetical protein
MLRAGRSIVLLVLMPAGCASQQSGASLVPDNPFGFAAAPPAQRRAAFTPASIETAARVDSLGRKILAANPQIGVRPLFRTIGVPQSEVFHYGTSEINITEGLAKQCQTDGQLAAVLCTELGKMVAEREALAGPQARRPQREPPQDVRIGSDNAGSFGTADQTHLAELAKFDQGRRHSDTPPPPPPDPLLLARTYLTKAGYAENNLEAAGPLLQGAAANSSLEKQMTPNAPARPWIH